LREREDIVVPVLNVFPETRFLTAKIFQYLINAGDHTKADKDVNRSAECLTNSTPSATNDVHEPIAPFLQIPAFAGMKKTAQHFPAMPYSQNSV